jgi:hypothetical protein
MKFFSFVVIDQYSSQHKDINALHECHITASGRDVYPISFWTVWQREIEAGRAFVILAKQGEQVRGACLCTISKSAAYYGIGAFDRSQNDTGLSHACLWQSICHAKKIGLPLFEMGKTYFSCLKPDVTDKEMSIGFFKRGFGGSNLPILHLRTIPLAGEGVDK